MREPAKFTQFAQPTQGSRRSGAADTLRYLLDQSQHLLLLQQRLDATLEAPLKGQCRIAHFTDGDLLLMVSTPALVTHARFQHRHIVASLAQTPEFSGIHKVTIKVLPPKHRKTYTRRAQKLSKANAELMQQLADEAGDDRLSQALRRLAKHHD